MVCHVVLFCFACNLQVYLQPILLCTANPRPNMQRHKLNVQESCQRHWQRPSGRLPISMISNSALPSCKRLLKCAGNKQNIAVACTPGGHFLCVYTKLCWCPVGKSYTTPRMVQQLRFNSPVSVEPHLYILRGTYRPRTLLQMSSAKCQSQVSGQ